MVMEYEDRSVWIGNWLKSRKNRVGVNGTFAQWRKVTGARNATSRLAYKIIDLEGTHKGHLVQPPAGSRKFFREDL